MEASENGVLRRVLSQAGGEELLDMLAGTLSGADLTSLLLEVMRRRAGRLTPADVLRQYRTDRFVSPSKLSMRDLRRVEDAMFGALPDEFEVITLAPVLPLGSHSAASNLDPRNVIATVRRTEVAADPTNGLALEAAVLRGQALDADPRSAEPVRLATTQRVTRAQRFEGPVSFAHFQLFAVVTAGRDTGSHEFERRHLIEHLRLAVRGLAAADAAEVKVAITRLDDAAASILADVQAEFESVPGVLVVDAPERESGRTYYRCLCFKIFVDFGGSPAGVGGAVAGGAAVTDAAEGRSPAGPVEISDGGFVDWTAKLLGNQKERLLISGHGLDRAAILSAP